MRRRRHLLLGSVVMFLLAGCTGADEGEMTEPKPAKLTGEITVAASGGESELETLQEVADAFEAENEGTTVVLDTVEEPGELIAKLTTAFLAQTPPDVFVLNYRRLGGLEATGGIAPVEGVDTSGLFDKPLEAFTFDGELACLPSNASSMVVYFNPAVFEEAGVEPPQPGWTQDDMLAKAHELADKGVSAIGFSTELIRLAPFVWSNGGEFFDSLEDPTAVDLSSDEAREAIDFMLELQETGMDATERAGQEPEDAFAAGKIGMYLDSRRAVPGFRGAKKLAFDVASVPAAETATTVLHSDGYCVTKLAENPDVAKAFAEYVVIGDGGRILAEAGRIVPVNEELANSPSFLTPGEDPVSSQIFIDQLELARPLPHSPTWNEAEEVTEEILTQLFAGELSVDEAIEQIQQETERELAKD
jgi:multiple sugar transport system substrate-binding protein